MNLPITDTGERPVGKQGFCFYCGQPVGSLHTRHCVIPKRAVVVTRTIQYIIDIPRNWTARDIEFSRNESSSCANNDLHALCEVSKIEKGGCCCSCLTSHTVYDREATEYEVIHLPRTFSFCEQN